MKLVRTMLYLTLAGALAVSVVGPAAAQSSKRQNFGVGGKEAGYKHPKYKAHARVRVRETTGSAHYMRAVPRDKDKDMR